MSQRRFCPNCGAEVPPGVKFCTQCGAPLEAAPAAPAYGQPYAQPAPQQPQPYAQTYTPPPPPQPQPYAQQYQQPPYAQPIPKPVQEVSNLWYLLPFFLAIIGGIIAWVMFKDKNPRKARNMLIFGIIWTVVWIIADYVILPLLFYYPYYY